MVLWTDGHPPLGAVIGKERVIIVSLPVPWFASWPRNAELHELGPDRGFFLVTGSRVLAGHVLAGQVPDCGRGHRSKGDVWIWIKVEQPDLGGDIQNGCLRRSRFSQEEPPAAGDHRGSLNLFHPLAW